MGGLRGAMGYELYGYHIYTHEVQKDRWCPYCYPWPIIPDKPWPALQAINLTHPRLPARLPPDGTGGPDPA